MKLLSIDALLSVLLAVLVIGLGIRLHGVSEDNERLNSELAELHRSVSETQFVPLLDSLEGRQLSSRELVNAHSAKALGPLEEPTLLVLFTPTDCQICFEEVDLWNRIGKKAAKVGGRVVAVISEANRREALGFAKAYGISVPLYLDAENELYNRLGLDMHRGASPIKIIVDGDGVVLDATRTLPLRTAEYDFYERRSLRLLKPSRADFATMSYSDNRSK